MTFRSLLLGITVLGSLFSVRPVSADSGPACDRGDLRLGPNCVHEVTLTQTASSEYDSPVTFSTVYRPTKDGQQVVWGEDPGRVVESATNHIRIKLQLKLKDGSTVNIDETYKWDGSKYTQTH
jgi:hypothetical protein